MSMPRDIYRYRRKNASGFDYDGIPKRKLSNWEIKMAQVSNGGDISKLKESNVSASDFGRKRSARSAPKRALVASA